MAEFSWRTVEQGKLMTGPGKGGGLFSPAAQAERSSTGKRLLWAVPLAVAVLVIIALLGPSAETIERKFTPYGKSGELQLMPEISVDDGQQEASRQAASEASPPPPAPDFQVEPEELSPNATELTPTPSETVSELSGQADSQADQPESDVVVPNDSMAQVDMEMPSQRVDSDFIITKLVRPLYPPHASQADRARPVITVKAAFFVKSDGEVTALIINSNDGGPEFAEAARMAMEQWEFEPRLKNGELPAARWLVVTWRFRSPYSGLQR